MNLEETKEALKEALRLLARRCPRLTRLCYWAGTSAMSIEELGHRASFDLDFHTRKALEDVRPILAEIQDAFPGGFEIIQAPDEFGGGFRGLLTLTGGEKVTMEVLSNYQDISESELVHSTTAPGFRRISLSRYLADKIQCIAERMEARDLVDLGAVLQRHPGMRDEARRIVAEQDALLLAERLLKWTPEGIDEDLASYPDANPQDALETRRVLLEWLKEVA